MPLFGNLVRSNAVVTVQAVTVAQADGGTVETFSTVVATGVPVLITGMSGSRDAPYGTDAATDRGKLSGVDASLNRLDVRLLVTTAPTDRPEMLGWYLRITPVGHPGGQYGLVGQRVTADWSRVEIPVS